MKQVVTEYIYSVTTRFKFEFWLATNLPHRIRLWNHHVWNEWSLNIYIQWPLVLFSNFGCKLAYPWRKLLGNVYPRRKDFQVARAAVWMSRQFVYFSGSKFIGFLRQECHMFSHFLSTFSRKISIENYLNFIAVSLHTSGTEINYKPETESLSRYRSVISLWQLQWKQQNNGFGYSNVSRQNSNNFQSIFFWKMWTKEWLNIWCSWRKKPRNLEPEIGKLPWHPNSCSQPLGSLFHGDTRYPIVFFRA